MIFFIWFVVIVILAICLYYAYIHFAPQALQDKLVGIKTKFLGYVLTVFAFLSQIPPLLAPYLDWLQTSGLEKYLPTEKQALAIGVVGLLVIMCRLWTARGV